MKKRIDFALLFDMRCDFKPFGIWITDGKLFEQYYIRDVEYGEYTNYFHERFDHLDFSDMDWHGFWDYWTSQGGYNLSISNPFSVATEKSISKFGQDAIKDLNKFMDWLKANKFGK